MDLPIITIPPYAEHTHTIIFLHGRGDSADALSKSILHSTTSRDKSLPQSLPSFRWVFPQAETRLVSSARLELRWPQWFDIWNTRDFHDREGLQAEGLRESVASLRIILRREAETLGGRWDRVVLAGISQGGATAVHTLLNLGLEPMSGGGGRREGGAPSLLPLSPESRRLGALITFASRMPFAGGTIAETREVLSLDGVPEDDSVIRNTPMLLEHCIDDPQVLVGWGRNLRDQLMGYEAQVTWREYEQGGHWFNSPGGMDDVMDFLRRELRLPEDTG